MGPHRNTMTPGKVENVLYIVRRFMNLVSDYPYSLRVRVGPVSLVYDEDHSNLFCVDMAIK